VGPVVCLGTHILDVLGRPVTELPPGQGRLTLQEIRATAAGTAAGTSVNLAKLGVDVRNIGAVGDDALGELLLSLLDISGVDHSLVIRKEGAATSATILLIRPNGERPAMHAPGADRLLTADDISDAHVAAIMGAAVVHVGGPDVLTGLDPATLAVWLRQARGGGAVVTLDLLRSVSPATAQHLAPLLREVDWCLPNEEQIKGLTGQRDLRAAIRTVRSFGPSGVAVTCGADGCLLQDGEDLVKLPALPVDVVDTTGCGDAFDAGFITGLLLGNTPAEAAWLATACAAAVATGLGSDAGIVDLEGCLSLLEEPRLGGADLERATEAAKALRARASLAGLVEVRGRRHRRRGKAGRPYLDRPRYASLPLADGGGHSAWKLFGEGDSVGLLNTVTPSDVVNAARLVRRGAVFPLNAPIDLIDPPLDPARRRVRHQVLATNPEAVEGLDDVLDDFFPQASSQWDSLAHIAWQPGVFYNGATLEDIKTRGRNTVDHWARRGIVARAVLLDVERAFGAKGRGPTAVGSLALSPSDLELTRAYERVAYSSGCVLLLRTGFLAWYRDLDRAERSELPTHLSAPGLEHTEDMAAYLWDNGVAAVAADNFSVEVWPPDRSEEARPFGFLHRALMGLLGMAIGELWDLDALAEDCAQDGRYESLLVSAPLHVPGGIGSPANALALK
jgi:sugar/nucleoside kinase (ribokinase family)